MPRDFSLTPREAPQSDIQMQEVDGFVLVTRSMDMRRPLPPYVYHYEHSQHLHLETALDDLRDYRAGEYPGREGVGIYPVYRGQPLGGFLSEDALAVMARAA